MVNHKQISVLANFRSRFTEKLTEGSNVIYLPPQNLIPFRNLVLASMSKEKGKEPQKEFLIRLGWQSRKLFSYRTLESISPEDSVLHLGHGVVTDFRFTLIGKNFYEALHKLVLKFPLNIEDIVNDLLEKLSDRKRGIKLHVLDQLSVFDTQNHFSKIQLVTALKKEAYSNLVIFKIGQMLLNNKKQDEFLSDKELKAALIKKILYFKSDYNKGIQDAASWIFNQIGFRLNEDELKMILSRIENGYSRYQSNLMYILKKTPLESNQMIIPVMIDLINRTDNQYLIGSLFEMLQERTKLTLDQKAQIFSAIVAKGEFPYGNYFGTLSDLSEGNEELIKKTNEMALAILTRYQTENLNIKEGALYSKLLHLNQNGVSIPPNLLEVVLKHLDSGMSDVSRLEAIKTLSRFHDRKAEIYQKLKRRLNSIIERAYVDREKQMLIRGLKELSKEEPTLKEDFAAFVAEVRNSKRRLLKEILEKAIAP